MKSRKLIAILTAGAIVIAMLGGCGGTKKGEETAAQSEGADKAGGELEASKEIKEFTAFFAVPGTEINDDNEIQQIIAEITGARVKETWLTGQTAAEAVGTMIAGGEYPDFIDGNFGTAQLYEAGALVALDDYLDRYPNIKAFYSEEQWDKIRQDDGKIYWIPQFNNVYEKDMAAEHTDQAFWIQTRVLKWDNYPQIKTLDQYFDLIERYQAANPTMEDGTQNIPYTLLCDDWRYFSLENVPQFLDGYPGDGSVIVDTETLKVVDYNTTPTAKRYFEKLNEGFHKGIVDPESFTQTYDEYIAKLSTGRVLGMSDGWWNFAYSVNDSLKQQGLDAQGCNYVPLPITIDESIQNQWRVGGGFINEANGLAITISCEDVEGALQFINDLLEPEVLTLRNWGVAGVDYEVDEDGVFYRTEEMEANPSDLVAYKASHSCSYAYFPNYVGMSHDGINAAKPSEQPNIFFEKLPSDVQECLSAYGCSTYVDMIGSSDSPGPWFPMYSHSNNMTTATEGGMAWAKMAEVKHEYLPKVIMAEDFESGWEEYMGAYDKCNPQAFLEEMQTELDRRIQMAQ